MSTVNMLGSYQRDDFGENFKGSVNVYSFRAECQHDVMEFLTALFSCNNRVLHVVIIPHCIYPDTRVELGLAERADEALIALLENQPDSHVILETLRFCPLSDNPLSRFYDPYPLQTGVKK